MERATNYFVHTTVVLLVLDYWGQRVIALNVPIDASAILFVGHPRLFTPHNMPDGLVKQNQVEPHVDIHLFHGPEFQTTVRVGK